MSPREEQLNVIHHTELPDIDCVIIGVNCEKTLERCIESILVGKYPEHRLHITYSDGGSTDRSVILARKYSQVNVIALKPEYPTPGLGRNAGWKAGSAPYVQFLDSDTILDPDWLHTAIHAINNPKVGAVRGYRREEHPERSFFNWIGNLEWNTSPGFCDSFGGDVLIRRTALEDTGGYDEELVGGEDPELSWRIVQHGWKIIMLDALMTTHDLAMLKTSQYIRRSFRSGYGFAAVRSRISNADSNFWKADQRRIILKSGGFFILWTTGICLLTLQHDYLALAFSALFFIAGITVLFAPRIFKIEKFMRDNNLSRADAKKYAWHCSLVVIPQVFGIIRYYAGSLLNTPLKNRSRTLKTELSTLGI